MAARLNGRPATLLRVGRRAELLLEPTRDCGMEVEPLHRYTTIGPISKLQSVRFAFPDLPSLNGSARARRTATRRVARLAAGPHLRHGAGKRNKLRRAKRSVRFGHLPG